MSDLSKITLPNGTTYDLKDATARKGERIWYGTCETAAGTQAKVATTTTGDFVLAAGSMVRITFINASTYNGISTLNVDDTGEYDLVRIAGSTTTRYHWLSGETVDIVFDGEQYVMSAKGIATTTYYGLTKLLTSVTSTSAAYAATPASVKQAYDLADSKADHQPTAYCDTTDSTTAKTASCDGYELTSNSYTHVTIENANTAQSALTLNINSKGAKPIYINGAASSSSNYTLPAGTYIVFYDGTNYYFRTDGAIPTNGVSVNEKARMVYNSTTASLDFVFE